MDKKNAIILGASGSVGRALLSEIVQSNKFDSVLVITRRPLESNLDRIVQELILSDMTPSNLRALVVDTLAKIDTEVLGFSVLGVGSNTAKLTFEEHKAIDVDLNAAFANGLKDSGKVRHLAFMTAVGANINAKSTGSGAAGMARYARVKGEAEAAVLSQGLEAVSIFRPSLIVGSRHTPPLLSLIFSGISKLIPANYRPIHTTEIAKSMIARSLITQHKSATYHYLEMKKLITETEQNSI